jgi:hypothetical protein
MKECFDYDDLRKIREILFRAIISADSGDANDIVNLVNVIQVKFGEEPYSDINDFMRRQYWSQNLGNIKELPEIEDIALRNTHYGHILEYFVKSLEKGWNDDEEDEILETINICLRNYNEDALCGYDSIETFLEEWEELIYE